MQKEYRVTIYFSRTFTVEAENEAEAEYKAHEEFRGSFNSVPIPDEYEVECLGEDEE
jgi:hypothetical protein